MSLKKWKPDTLWIQEIEAKQNNFIDEVSQEMGDSSNDTSTCSMSRMKTCYDGGTWKNITKKPSKILSSDAISIVFTNNWQFLGNIAHHIFVVQCSVEPRSQVSMTGMQLTRQEAQTSKPQLSVELYITCKNTLFTIYELQSKNVPLRLLKTPSGDKSGFNVQLMSLQTKLLCLPEFPLSVYKSIRLLKSPPGCVRGRI